MEAPFDKLPGVVSVIPGYSGGGTKNPTYEQVSAGGTGHAEVVQIVFDPSKTSYSTLLDIFWHNIDPTVKDRQFCDTGNQYRSAIFYQGEEQRRAGPAIEGGPGEEQALQGSRRHRDHAGRRRSIAAEEYHQHYYKKNPLRYNYYRTSCGRDKRLKELWGAAASH